MATKYIRSWFILPPPPASLPSYSASCASTVLLSLFVWCKRIVKEMSHCSVYSYNPLKNLFHYTCMYFIKGCLLGDGILNCVMRSSLPCFPTLPYIWLRVHYFYIFLTKLMHLYGCFPKIELYVVNVLTIRPFNISRMFFCRLHPVWMEHYSNWDWCSCPSGCNSTWRHCKTWRELLQEFKIAWVFNATLLFIKAASYLPRQNLHTWYTRENSSWAQWRLWRH